MGLFDMHKLHSVVYLYFAQHLHVFWNWSCKMQAC